MKAGKKQPRRRGLTLGFYLVALGALAIDQGTKTAIAHSWPLYHSVPVIPGFLHVTYARNTGAAFSLFSGHVVALSLVALVVSVGIIIYQHVKRPTDWSSVVGLALILGGAIGNFIDRVAFGYVRDMIDVRWFGENIWPIFNLADTVLMTGVALLILNSLRTELSGHADRARRDGGR